MPFIAFDCICNITSEDRAVNEFGSEPIRELVETSKDVRDIMVPMQLGMVPDNLFEDKCIMLN